MREWTKNNSQWMAKNERETHTQGSLENNEPQPDAESVSSRFFFFLHENTRRQREARDWTKKKNRSNTSGTTHGSYLAIDTQCV